MAIFAGQIVTADFLHNLDTSSTYTPALTATTTDPNLGADGTAEGTWHRNGTRITGWVKFKFDGSGISAGSGFYEFELPFNADSSLYTLSGVTGEGSSVGSGVIEDSSAVANSRPVIVFLDSEVGLARIAVVDGTNSALDDSTITWAAGDTINVTFAYVADSSVL